MTVAETSGQVAELTGEHCAELGEAALLEESLEAAVSRFTQAERLGIEPDRCAGGRWMAYMLAGNFEAAWRESDAIRLRGGPDPHRFWNGEELRGKRVILRSLHGFGDAVQMFRFLPRLRELVSELILEVPPRLLYLAPCFEGMGEVITWGELAPSQPPVWDMQMEVMELPYVLRVSSERLTPTSGYLRLPPEKLGQVSEVMGPKDKPRVGVVWSAGSWNPSRSIPFEDLRALLDVPGLEFWSLQGDSDRSVWTAQASEQHRDVYECGDDIPSLAATISQLDLVITVDTLAAHLAGALGVSCWLLLQYRADWRWMAARSDTPWYPSLRLIRQGSPGGWAELVAEVRADLENWSGLRAAGTVRA